MVLHCELWESNPCWLPQWIGEQAAVTSKSWNSGSGTHTHSILAGTQGKGPSGELFLHTQIHAWQVAIFGISLFWLTSWLLQKGAKGKPACCYSLLTSPTNVFISKAITGTFKIIFSSLILGLGKSMLLTESFTNLNQKYVLQPKDRIQMPPSAHHWSILRITRPWQMYTSRPQSIHLLKPPQWQLLLLSPVLPPQLCKNKENAVTALVSQTTLECYTEVW